MKRLLLLGSMLSVLLAGCGETTPGADRLPLEEAAAPAAEAGPAGTRIPSRYIVVFHDRVANPAARANVLMTGSGGQTHFTYSHAIKGFAATIPDAVLPRIQADPDVAYVEQDQTVSLSESESRTQTSPTWGLDRVDQQSLPLDGSYGYEQSSQAPEHPVRAYVIDTGIRATHREFGGWVQNGGRVERGFTSINDGRGTDDCNGHGTHVAGTIGGNLYGVAKNVRLVPVRVLNCRGSGTWSGVIAGIDWVTANAVKPAVANMSLGGGASDSVDQATSKAIDAGVTMVVAAGNSGADACGYSPARTERAITVGATDRLDVRASWSNWGTCLDLFAPGVSITSAWHKSDTETNTISGTSMASPHVAGVAALLHDLNRTATTETVTKTIVDKASAGKVTDPAGSANLLAYSRATIDEQTGGGDGGGGGGGDGGDGATTTVEVATLTGQTTLFKNRWTATANVVVKVAGGFAVVENATVSGSFVPGGSGSCTTDKNGACGITSSGINNRTSSTTFEIQSIGGTNLSDDGASGPRTLTINKDGSS